MNIFILSTDIKEAARYHVDKHIVKMPLESAQMLCTALILNGFNDVEYKPAHIKHPCTKWAAANRDNFRWLCDFSLELCFEYTYRYNKQHACQNVIQNCYSKCNNIPEGTLTKFAQAMPIEYKKECAIEAYRLYYMKAKNHLATWKKREKPCWFSLV